MDQGLMKSFDESLDNVMNRFRAFFLEHQSHDNVPFRHRDDFAAPLVTVMGYTYGVRLVKGGREGGSDMAVEVSANVYDEEFLLDRFRFRMKEAHEPEMVRRTVENFMSPEDAAYVKKGESPSFPAFFSYDLQDDLQLIQKKKNTPSTVTGLLTDSILVMKYWIKPAQMKLLSRDRRLFEAAVYLYCLRTFVLAYHKSVTSD